MRHQVSSLLLLLFVSLSVQNGIWNELFTMDCNGGIHIASSSGFAMHVQTQLLNISTYLATESIKSAVNCKCPIGNSITEADFERNFAPTAGAALYVFQGDQQVAPPSCITNNFERGASTIDFMEMELPSSCSLAGWESGSPCYAQYNVPSLSLQLQLAIDRCPSSYLPYISATCAGAGCSTLLQPCNTDSDCGTLQCHNLRSESQVDFFTDIFTTLQDMYLYDDDDTYPGCYPVSSVVNYVAQYVYSLYSTTTAPAFGDWKVCGLDPYNTTNIENDFDSCTTETTDINTACAISDEYYDVSCTNLQSWTGILSDGSSSVAANRKDGTFFFPTPLALPAADLPTDGALPIIGGTCDGIYSFMGQQNYGLTFKFDTRNMVNAFGTFVSNVESCRTGNTLNADQLRSLFGMWSLDFWLYGLAAPEQPSLTTRSTFQDIFDFDADDGKEDSEGIAFGRLEMPSTCTLEYLQANGQCSLKWSGLGDLLTLDITIRLRLRTCGQNAAPEFYVECEGTDCQHLINPTLCDTNADCPTSLICKPLSTADGDDDNWLVNGYNPLGLLLWGVSDTPTTCPQNYLEEIPAGNTCPGATPSSWYSFLQNTISVLSGNTPTKTLSATGVNMCLFDYDNLDVHGWIKASVTNDGKNVVLKGLTEWDNPFPNGPSPSSNGGGPNGSNGGTTGTTAGSSSAASVVSVSVFAVFVALSVFI
uniref:Predicted protein n=1 Tax=Hordeum vulgare subsp. vulgare TaxID=112509 RepID=F2E5P6_HORVV|nr:predicted protein [Hordeum vulgare subsp. vulgare]